jgi:transcriptional regulator with XRE-family HTH domain
MPENPLYAPPSERDEPTVREWTASQLVSYNLLRARRSKGLTQQEFGDELGRYTGRAWSNASVSAAERAWQGGRPRKFDVDEINAFCSIFDVPFSYFLLPPDGDFLIFAFLGTEQENATWVRGTPAVEYLRRILAVDPSADFVDRAQAAVNEHASLDFIPARWDRTWGAVEEPAPQPARPLTDRTETAPTEEMVENAKKARTHLEKVVRKLGLTDQDMDILMEARGEDLAYDVAVQLEKMGFLRIPNFEERLADLNERIDRLTGGRDLD